MKTHALTRAARRAFVRIVVGAALLGAAAAAPAEDRGWFVGVAQDDTQVEVFRGLGWEAGAESSGFALQGGYRFAKHGAAGIGYRQASDLQWTESSAYFSDTGGWGEAATRFDSSALQASVIGIWTPGGGIFEIHAKLGLAAYSFDGEQVLTEYLRASSVTRHVGASGTDVLVGFGIGLTVVPAWHVSFGYEYYEFDEGFLGVDFGDGASLDSATLGVQYRFAGRRRER
jgi:hypothetical protein